MKGLWLLPGEERLHLVGAGLLGLLVLGCMVALRAGVAAPDFYLAVQATFPEFAVLGAGALVLRGVSVPARFPVLALAMLVAVGTAWRGGAGLFATPVQAFAFALLGFGLLPLGSGLVLGPRAELAWRLPPAAAALCLVVLTTLSQTALLTVDAINPVYDPVIRAMERGLGVHVPSLIWVVVRLSAFGFGLMWWVYMAITAAVGLHDAVRPRGAGGTGMVTAFAVAAAVAYPCYLIVPVVGPYVFDPGYLAALWPAGGGGAGGPEWLPVAAARSGMPSLHITWALLLLMRAGEHRHRALRIAFAGFALLTVPAAMTIGQHWLLDAVVAAPFAVGVEAGLRWLGGVRAGGAVAVRCAAIVALWFLAMRVWPPGFAPGFVACWLAVLATLAAAWVMYRRLPRVCVLSRNGHAAVGDMALRVG